MNAAMQASLDDLAHKIKLRTAGGENITFEEKNDDWVARIKYEATIGEDNGDRWTAPSWWVEQEKTTVEYVFDRRTGEDDTEATNYLINKFN